MRNVFFIMVLAASLVGPGISSYADQTQNSPSVYGGPDISARYLKMARNYREDGRYELARQAYLQALSTSRSNEDTAIIRHELGAIELLLRTMR
jgi:hypothetical protein